MFISTKGARRLSSDRRAALILFLCAAHLLGALPVSAQQGGTLPEGATVTALGRTSQVRGDGSFTISNVPATIGRFRVRLIHPDGTTAESGGLTPVNRGRTFVPPLLFGPLTPLPASLGLSAPTNQFTAQGQTAQLTVSGNFADGTSADLTADPLTTYQSSNATFAAVSAGGLVTVNRMPLFPSRVTVTVMNEGVVGTISFALNPDTDVDGDGLPNDWERRHRFDPNSAADAAQDADADGLSNLQEFQLGTAPRDRDTDRDGLADGADPEPLRPETTPPSCVITSPPDGATFVEQEVLTVSADASDNVRVARVELSSSAGGLALQDSTAPYATSFTVPAGVSQVTFDASAFDVAGNRTAAAPVTINVVPDPLTTVVGRVLDEENAPASGATVSARGRTATADPEGRFTIEGVTTLGDVVVNAGLTRPDGTRLSGASAPTPPARGGVTDVGDIHLSPAAFEESLGTRVLRQDDGTVSRSLPFGFAFYGQNYTRVFVNNNGNLTFSFATNDFTETAAELLGSQPRVAAFWDDLVPDFTFGDAASGLYVNDQLPGRFVVTWLRQLEFDQVPGPSTVQAILYSDGRIQLAFRGVSSLDAVVGLSPGGLAPSSPAARAVDFSAAPLLSTAAGEAVYEQFEVPAPRGDTDSLGSGARPGRDSPFDLDGGFILFTPNAAGGYDVRTIAAPAPPALGAVSGTVTDAGGRPLQNAEVEVVSSLAPTVRAVTNTDARGRYYCPRLPAGGVVRVTASRAGRRVGQGAGRVNAGGGTVVVNVRPARPPQRKGGAR